MAKKGGVQQLQADLQTDEDFEKFIERPGLLVLDVYSEWCGPCLGMVGSLKKIKLELGGDNLQLAICKSDTISYLKRFNKKSEPSWLFVTNGVAVNLMFGTNVPKLLRLITTELALLTSKQARTTYPISEMQPEEVVRYRKKQDAIAESIAIEVAEKERKRHNYLTYVTDMVIENLPDVGVTLFGPQVNRDMFKKITEPADKLKIQCKDRRVVQVTKENFEVINFACNNPLDEDIIDLIDGKELLVCFWKVPDDAIHNVAGILQKFAHELTKTPTPEDGDPFDKVYKPILAPMDVKVEVEIKDGEEWEDEEEEEPPPPPPQPDMRAVPSKVGKEGDGDEEGDEGEDEGEGEGEGEDDGGQGEGQQPDDGGMPMDFELDLMLGDEDEEIEKEAEPEIEEPPKKRTRKKTYKIPPVWVGNNHRTHAAMVYVFFRQQTTPFLEPDPIPEPPHVVMAFDAYKKKDLIGVAERHKDDVLLYGFFTSDDADEAKLIATTVQKYVSKPQQASDKIVFKVAKQTSHTMLSLATYGPSYVSPNAVIGKEEALKFFPVDYATIDTQEKIIEEEQKETKKKKKSKSKSTTSDTALAPTKEGTPESAPVDEGATTTSGEESGEDSARRSQNVDGTAPPVEGAAEGTADGAPAVPTEGEAAPVAAEGTATEPGAAEAAPTADAEAEPPAPAATEENPAPAPEPAPAE